MSEWEHGTPPPPTDEDPLEPLGDALVFLDAGISAVKRRGEQVR